MESLVWIQILIRAYIGTVNLELKLFSGLSVSIRDHCHIKDIFFYFNITKVKIFFLTDLGKAPLLTWDYYYMHKFENLTWEL